MNEIISSRGGETSGENNEIGNTAWENLQDVPFSEGEKTDAPEISDKEAVAQIFRNMNAARKEAIAADNEGDAARLALDMDMLNDAYNRMNEPENKGKTMVDMFNEMRQEYFGKAEETDDIDEKNALYDRMNSTSDLGSTYEDLKKYATGQLGRKSESVSASVENKKAEVVDISSKIEDLRAEIVKREASLNVLRSYDQRDYGSTVISAESHLYDRKNAFNLLERMLRRNDYNAEMTGDDAQKILGEMVENRDKVLATIDKKLENTEKGSDEWKRLKANRREAYSRVPDESVDWVLKEVFNLGSESRI